MKPKQLAIVAAAAFPLGMLLGWSLTPSSHPADREAGFGSAQAHDADPHKADAPAKADSHATADSHAGAPSHAPPAADHDRLLLRADTLLRESKFAAALAVYRELGKAAAGRHAQIELRAAACLEGQGDLEGAVAEYRRAGAKAHSELELAVTEFSLARALLKAGHAAEAKAILAKLLLRADSAELHDHPLLADTRFLSALAQAAACRLDEAVPAPHRISLRTLPAEWTVFSSLDWLSQPATPHAAPVKTAEELKVAAAGPALHEIKVAASSASATVADLLERLQRFSGVPCHVSAQAQRSLEGRSVQLSTKSMALTAMFGALADATELVLQIKDDELWLTTAAELKEDEVVDAQRLQAERVLLAAVRADESHPWARAAYLNLGHLQLTAGQPDGALTWYERVYKNAPRAPETMDANLHAGMTLAQRGQATRALTALYRVVDQNPWNELSSLALVRIGQVHLAQGEPARAVTPLNRALLGKSQVHGDIVVSLAAAHLLDGQPRKAYEVIRAHRSLVEQGEHQPIAAFLDALARTRLAPKKASSSYEASDLWSALAALPEESALGGVGRLLVGQAYRELGAPLRMAEVFEAALPSLRGLLAEEMAIQLADVWYGTERSQDAINIYAGLAVQDDGPWAALAKLRLAEIALADRRPEDGLLWCNKLLNRAPLLPERDVLKLMGDAYLQTGQLRLAAQCYAGKRPDTQTMSP